MKHPGKWARAAIAVMSDENPMTVPDIEQSIRERRLYLSRSQNRIKTLRAQLDNFCINASRPQRPGPPYYFRREGERFLLHPGSDLAAYRSHSHTGFAPVPTLSVPKNMPPLAEEITQPRLFVEGATTTIAVNKYERSVEARQCCLDHYGCLCSVCDFSFLATYGELGQGFIHVHHLKELSVVGEAYQINPITDLLPICPNCHAMTHRTDPPMTIEALRHVVKQQRQSVFPAQ